MDDYNDDIDKNVDSLIEQLRNTKNVIREAPKQELEVIKTNDQIENFVIEKASGAVSGCAEMLASLSDSVKDGCVDPETIESIAELTKAMSSMMETLAKFNHNKNNNQTKIQIQKMAIEAKMEKDDPKEIGVIENGVVISREGVLKLIEDSLKNKKEDDIKTIDVQEPN